MDALWNGRFWRKAGTVRIDVRQVAAGEIERNGKLRFLRCPAFGRKADVIFLSTNVWLCG
jgi:hypothetical protein